MEQNSHNPERLLSREVIVNLMDFVISFLHINCLTILCRQNIKSQLKKK
uniref:Uncharacterized protein n=1 Tax=Rhizophora mucronata TaxID=61149 RepID=A0A2P2NWS5_RHIMU